MATDSKSRWLHRFRRMLPWICSCILICISRLRMFIMSLGITNYQTNLVDWYPFIVPYVSGQGWLLHPPANVGEHLAYDVENFDMTLHLTDSNVHAVVAASAPAETITYGWRYRLANVRSFAFSVSHEFQDGFNQSKWGDCKKLLL